MRREHDERLRPLPLDRPQLVAIDVDGVLLRSDGSLSAQTVAAVGEAAKAGVRVVLATARPPRGVADIYRTLRLDTLQINHNGAVIYDPPANKLMFHRPMAGRTARRVIQAARQIDAALDIGVELVDRFYTDRSSIAFRGEAYVGRSAGQGSPLEAILDRSVTKIMILGSPQIVGRIQMDLGQQFAGEVGFAYSHHRLVQVVAAGVDKAVALAKVAGHYGIDPQRVMAIGDAPNDAPMLRWAGLAVAVANAWEDVRRMADFLVPSNDEDGLAQAIHKHVLW